MAKVTRKPHERGASRQVVAMAADVLARLRDSNAPRIVASATVLRDMDAEWHKLPEAARALLRSVVGRSFVGLGGTKVRRHGPDWELIQMLQKLNLVSLHWKHASEENMSPDGKRRRRVANVWPTMLGRRYGLYSEEGWMANPGQLSEDALRTLLRVVVEGRVERGNGPLPGIIELRQLKLVRRRTATREGVNQYGWVTYYEVTPLGRKLVAQQLDMGVMKAAAVVQTTRMPRSDGSG